MIYIHTYIYTYIHLKSATQKKFGQIGGQGGVDRRLTGRCPYLLGGRVEWIGG